MLRDGVDADGFEFREIAFEKSAREHTAMLDEKKRNDEVPGRETQRMRAAEMIVEPRLGVAGFDFAQPAGTDPDGRSEVFLRYSPESSPGGCGSPAMLRWHGSGVALPMWWRAGGR